MDLSRLHSDLIRDEKLVLKAYQDTLGKWTIGVGHLLGSWKRVDTITYPEAMAWLDIDIAAAEKLARSLVPGFDGLTDARQRALVNMAFNRGQHMATSTRILPAIIATVQSGDWSKVRTAIEGSEWATQVKTRAIRIADMLVTGEDPA